MAKRKIKVRKKESFIEKNLGGSLVDVMKSDVVDNTSEKENENEVSVKDKDDKSKVKDESSEDLNIGNIAKKLKEGILAMIDNKEELTDKEIEESIKESDSVYNKIKDSLELMYEELQSQAKKRNFITEEKFKEYTKNFIDGLDNVKLTSKELVEILGSKKLDEKYVQVINTSIKFLNKTYTIIDQYINNKARNIIVDDYHGINKVDAIVETLKYISIAKDGIETDDSTIDLSKIELEFTHSEFLSLYSRIKYKNCKKYLDKLAKLIKFISEGEMNLIINNVEEIMFKNMEDITGKEFISNKDVEAAMVEPSEYISSIDKTLKFIDEKLMSETLNKKLRHILIFVKECLKQLLSRFKNILEEIKSKQGPLTIQNYMSEIKKVISNEYVLKHIETIVNKINKEVKCALYELDPLTIAMLDEDEEDGITVKMMFTNFILNSIISDDNVEHNIKHFEPLSVYIEKLVSSDESDTSLNIKDIITNNKEKILSDITRELIY